MTVMIKDANLFGLQSWLALDCLMLFIYLFIDLLLDSSVDW